MAEEHRRELRRVGERAVHGAGGVRAQRAVSRPGPHGRRCADIGGARAWTRCAAAYQMRLDEGGERTSFGDRGCHAGTGQHEKREAVQTAAGVANRGTRERGRKSVDVVRKAELSAVIIVF